MMRDILPDLIRWQSEGKSVALATVVETWGSSPRRAGAKMGIASDGQFSGSVSGGCVEAAVLAAGLESLETSRPQLLHFGVADETAWEVGLACGGSIDIFVQPLNTILFPFLKLAWLEEDQASVHVTVIRGPAERLGSGFLIREDKTVIGSHSASKDVSRLAQQALLRRESGRAELDEETEFFLEFIAPPPTLIVVGGVHIAIALISLAQMLGYRTVLVDPRHAWGNEERFPHVDSLIQAWPDEAFQQLAVTRETAVVMLTHDPRLDDPSLKIALSSPAFYVGALGSKSTQSRRRARLLESGLRESQLARVHAPIGLDIGAQTPEEIALAIMAEVVAAHRKRDRQPDEVGNLQEALS